MAYRRNYRSSYRPRGGYRSYRPRGRSMGYRRRGYSSYGRRSYAGPRRYTRRYTIGGRRW